MEGQRSRGRSGTRRTLVIETTGVVRGPWWPTERVPATPPLNPRRTQPHTTHHAVRSEEHTSELQSQSNLVCRLLLEKKKTVRTSPCGNLRMCHSRRVCS